MFRGLKEKFSTLQINEPQKLSILIITPETWSVNKKAKEFSCSRQIAKNAKDLRISKGVHQKIELMLDAIDIKQLAQNSENPLRGYKGCLQSQYFQFKKNNLDEGEILIVLYFNVNYKYIRSS